MSIYKQTNFAFRTEGTAVVLTIDKTDITMDYPTAFKVATYLNQVAHRAKRLAGDMSMYFNIAATLTDANADALEEQAMRDGTASFGGNGIPGEMTSGKLRSES